MIPKVLQQDFNYTYNGLSQEEKEKFQNSTILVTGCAGFLGYYFMRFFQNKQKELGLKRVIGVDNFMLGYPAWIENLKKDALFNIHKFDIIKDKIDSIEGADRADYIIHMASVASPMFYRQYPIETLDANIWGLRSLLDFYCEKPIKGFLFYSSSELYGDPDPEHIPTDEEYYGYVCATGPRACYDESKRFGETMCMLFAQKYNIPITVVRPFNNYGPGMRLGDKRLEADFSKNILENQDLIILSDGTPTRTFCYIADAINGYLKVLLYGKYDYFNIGIEKPEISVAQLAEIYQRVGNEVFGYTGKIVYAKSHDAHYLTNNPQRRCPNIDKARKLLGFNPSILVEEGVKRSLLFFKDSEKGDIIW